MGYNRTAPKRPVNMSLNEDLVRRARTYAQNLSETVEILLAEYVVQADALAVKREQQIAAHVLASNAFVAEHGTLADEFPTL